MHACTYPFLGFCGQRRMHLQGDDEGPLQIRQRLVRGRLLLQHVAECRVHELVAVV